MRRSVSSSPRARCPVAVLAATLLTVLSVVVAACGGDNRPQLQRGEEEYSRFCIQCHEGQDGIGSRLTRAGLSAYGTADLLYRYNRDFMPYGGEGILTEQQYRDITGYLLVRYDFVAEGFELTATNGIGLELR